MQKTFIKSLLLIIAFTFALSANYIFAVWTGPTQTPPGGNTPTPVHVGATDQVKDAGLSLNSLAVFGNGFFDGNVGIGVTNPQAKLDVAGGIKVGYDNNTCNSGKSGTIRYNNTTSCVEYCNGLNLTWLSIDAECPFIAPSIALTSCKIIKDNGFSIGDGIYQIDPDGNGQESPFDVYCNMTTDEGGWTLASKIKRTNSQWTYDSKKWFILGNEFNDNDFNLTSGEAKYKSFDKVSFNEVLLKDPINNKKTVYQIGANSLQNLFSSSGNNSPAYVKSYDNQMFNRVDNGGGAYNICISAQNAYAIDNSKINFYGGNYHTSYIRIGWYEGGSNAGANIEGCAFGIGVKVPGLGANIGTTAFGDFTTMWVR